MAAKKTTKKTSSKSKKPQFKEFKYSGKIFEYSGRIYSGREGSGKIQRRWPLSLCLNNVFTLKGVWLTQTKNNVFLSFPTWYDENNEEWKSYVFLSEDLNKERDAFVAHLCELVGIDAPEEEDEEDGDGSEFAEAGDDDLPF